MSTRIAVRRRNRAYRYTCWVLLVIAGMLIGVSPVPVYAQQGSPRVASYRPEAADPTAQRARLSQPSAVVAPTDTKEAEVVERTEFTRTERNSDGTYRTIIASRPLHWQDGATTQWKEFDNALKQADAADVDTSFENGANRFKVKFGKPDQVAKGKAVVRLSLGKANIDVTAVGTAPTGAQANGAQLTYTDAYPGADLRYTLDNERVKEDIILKQAPATAPVFTFDLKLKGVTATQQPDGTISLVDGGGATVFTMLTPFMLDSNPDPALRFSDAVRMTLKQNGKDQVQIQVLPDMQWLQDPARVYPVFVDPTTQVVNAKATNTAIVDQASPTTNYSNGSSIYVGKTSGGLRTDALLQFTNVNKLPREIVVTNATLWLDGMSGTNGMPVQIQRVTSVWNPATVTWNTAPGAVGVQTFNASVVADSISDNLVDVSALVRSWVRGEQPNYGMRLVSQGANGQAVRFSTTSLSTNLVITHVPETRNGINNLWTYTSQQYGGGNTGYMNTSTGNFVLQHNGGAIAARGFGVDLTHTYNSQDSYGLAQTDRPGAFYGEGWSFSQSLRLYELDNGNGVVFKDGSGGDNRVYAKDKDEGTTRKYVRPLHYNWTLTKDLANPPADASKVYTLAADAGGQKMYFDAGGKITRREDRNGNFLSYGYDANGRLITITDVAGRQTLLEYGGTGGRLSKITDMAGRVSTYQYDANGNLTAITHGVGTINATTRFAYDVGNMLSSITDPNNNTSNIGYQRQHGWDAASDVEGWIGAGNSTVAQSTEQKFRGAGSLRVNVNTGDQHADGAGAKRVFATPTAWNSVQQEVLAFVYLPAGSQVKARLRLFGEDGISYQGPMTTVTGGQWTALRMPQAQVNPAFKIKEVRVVVLTTDMDLTTPDLPAYTGPVWIDQVMVKGMVTSLTDAKPAKNIRASMRYDWLGRKTFVGRPDTSNVSREVAYQYSAAGQVTNVTNPLGYTSVITYDTFLRLTSIAASGDTPGSSKTVYNSSYYDNSNQAQTSQNEALDTYRRGVDITTGDTRYTLDSKNEKLRNSGQSYIATIYVRDAQGNVTEAQTNRYPAGAKLDPTFPAYTQQLRVIKFTYTTGGLLASMTDGRGNQTFC